jgi:cold-inducible RNA-binding protein
VICFLGVFPLSTKLYVGNLSYAVSNSDLERLFAVHGTVQSAKVIMDRDTGRSRGFGFVEMGNDREAQAAISALNGKEVGGRSLTVNEARPQQGDNGGSHASSARRGGFGGSSAGRRY